MILFGYFLSFSSQDYETLHEHDNDYDDDNDNDNDDADSGISANLPTGLAGNTKKVV